jgi:cell division protein FtsL
MKHFNRTQRFFQAYTMTPWRRQVQIIGIFSAFVVVVALVAGAYLWVTSLAATYGRQVQEIQATAKVVEDNIEDLTVSLGELTTTDRMQVLAEDRGYQSLATGSLEYLEVPGYPEDQPLVIAPNSSSDLVVSGPDLPAEFTESLIDWVRGLIYEISLGTGAAARGGGGD